MQTSVKFDTFLNTLKVNASFSGEGLIPFMTSGSFSSSHSVQFQYPTYCDDAFFG